MICKAKVPIDNHRWYYCDLWSGNKSKICPAGHKRTWNRKTMEYDYR